MPRFSLALAFAAALGHLSRFRLRYASVALAISIALIGMSVVLFFAPAGFPVGEVAVVEEGSSFEETAYKLAEERYIRFPLLFIALARLSGADRNIQAGDYLFHTHVGMTTVLHNLANGISGIALKRVAVLEGMTARDIATLLSEELPGFESDIFLEKAEPLEGYLFPDTYFFPEDATADEVIERMYENFEEKTAELEDELRTQGVPLPDIIVMASLLEREARDLDEKRMVAGILYHRLEIDMPLQVDAVFGYINKRETYNPSFSDLEIDSPYNTYLYRGLPPGPIANPGLASLLAAMTPLETDSLYYLTGDDGVMRYARTFAEHKVNRATYLD